MHMLAAKPGGFVDDDSIIIRLEQTPAEIVILSAADTSLALLAAQHPQQTGSRDLLDYPQVRLANLLHLRQPASIDLYLDEVLQHAELIVIDHLGGESYWPYGTERIVQLCRRQKIALMMFSGDNSEDLNLLSKSTVSEAVCRQCWRYLREGGADNARNFYRYLAQQFFHQDITVLPPKPIPTIGVFHPQKTQASVEDWSEAWRRNEGGAVVVVVFYRSHIQAGNTKVFTTLCEALQQQGMNPLPISLSSLKDDLCLQTLKKLCREYHAELILNTTAFACSSLSDEACVSSDNYFSLIDDLPILQLVMSGDNQQLWNDDTHGLRPRDIAMHVAMPEVDGRIITRAVSFKGLDYRCDLTQSDVVQYQPHYERIRFVAKLAKAWCHLRAKKNTDKRLALILANYPTREGRLGNGVGLDTPASIITIMQALKEHHYQVENLPADGDSLMRQLQQGITNDPDNWAIRPALQSLAMADYLTFFKQLPETNRQAINSRWGPPDQDPMLRQNRFMISGIRCGKVFIGIQPARGYQLDLMANYHDPDLIPPHYYLAFYCWLRHHYSCDAIVHVGKHGNLEWLPGKSVALSENCWPDLIFGPTPHLYPFIVNDPGEGTQAKRRTQAVIIDHLMPPLTRAENYGCLQDLERQLDEYYEALTLDPKRSAILRRNILKLVVEQNLHDDLGIKAPQTEEQEQTLLNSTDAYLCELKESQIRDGLHIFGRSPTDRLATDTLLALARYPVGNGIGRQNSLIRALADDLLDAADFDPLDADWQQAWHGVRPSVLLQLSDEPWRHQGDTRERLEWLAASLLQQQPSVKDIEQQGLAATADVLERVYDDLQPRLNACGEQENKLLLQGLNGRFIPPGPSGAPSRGRPDVLPTGRNFYSVDNRAIPTRTSWELGKKSAELLLEQYLQEEGDYPISIGLSVWGTATMRTGGDDIAQAFALMGVRPKWADGSQRVTDFEVLPLGILDRPRVDVTLRISGFFRDAFNNIIKLFDAAVQAVAKLDEAKEMNPIRARIQQETMELITQGMDSEQARQRAGFRVFSSKPGAYGAGLQGLIDSGQWQDDNDLASAFLNWGGYAYGQHNYGEEAKKQFSERLEKMELVVQNQDNREHDLLDSDDYYQFQGGMTAAVRHFSDKQPKIYFADHSNPQVPKIRSLEQEISRVIRSRVTNPKWIDGVKRHGYKGGFEMAATVDYLFAYDATARVVRDDQYAAMANAYLHNQQNRNFLQQHNPVALRDICERLLEAMQRGLWQEPAEHQKQIEDYLLKNEQQLEE